MAVSRDDIRTVVGIIGNVIALGLFLSPMPTIIHIWKKRTVDQFSAFPYLATFLNCLLWCVYGLPMVHPHSVLVLTINGSGLAIELFYILVFLAFSAGKSRLRILAAFLLELAFVGLVLILVLTLVHTTLRRSMVVGVLCIFFGALMYAAPLSIMKLVIATKSVEFMPLTLSVASLLNAACWTTYALIEFDLYITIPNALGILLATAQLALYAMYFGSTKRELEARKWKAGEAREPEVEVVVAPATEKTNRNNARK